MPCLEERRVKAIEGFRDRSANNQAGGPDLLVGAECVDSYCELVPPFGVFAEGPFLPPGAPFTPAAASEDDVPISPELLPLLDESDFVAGPFLLPGSPLTPTELSDGVRACLPVLTPGSTFGALSAAIAGAAAKSAANAAAAIMCFFMVRYILCRACCIPLSGTTPPQTGCSQAHSAHQNRRDCSGFWTFIAGGQHVSARSAPQKPHEKKRRSQDQHHGIRCQTYAAEKRPDNQWPWSRRVLV